MMRDCPCSTKTREVLENPSPALLQYANSAGWALQFKINKAKTPCKLRKLGLQNQKSLAFALSAVLKH